MKVKDFYLSVGLDQDGQKRFGDLRLVDVILCRRIAADGKHDDIAECGLVEDYGYELYISNSKCTKQEHVTALIAAIGEAAEFIKSQGGNWSNFSIGGD